MIIIRFWSLHLISFIVYYYSIKSSFYRFYVVLWVECVRGCMLFHSYQPLDFMHVLNIVKMMEMVLSIAMNVKLWIWTIDWIIRPHTFTILHCSHLHITVLEKRPIINQFVVNKWILNNWNDTNQFSRNRKIPWTQNMNLERFNGINVIWREEADVEKERIRR